MTGGRTVANEDHLRILRQGVSAWNRWREDNPGVRPDLREADLHGASLNAANLIEADLEEARLSTTYLIEADLRGARLVKSHMNEARLNRANLSEADIRDAHLSEANLSQADLTHANLRDAIVSQANLIGANLSKAILRSTGLSRANLSRANLTLANLIKANLDESDLSEANLTRANLSNARLTRTHFNKTKLDDANLAQAVCAYTEFISVDLAPVKGLDAIEHLGPSSLGVDTLYLSRGMIPEPFLRGCGVPQHLIDALPYLISQEQPLQFYSCFISYSHRDEEFAKRLHSRLRDNGLRVWYAPEDMRGGWKLHEQIYEAIRIYDKFLLVLSEHSMESEWVATEIRRARKVEVRDGRRKLFPIRLVSFQAITDWECFDADTGKELGVEVREYFIPDFSNWKDHDAFEAAFARLIQDLEATI